MANATPWARDQADMIDRALAVDGGHLFIGAGGFVLAHACGSKLSGHDVASIKAACVAAGLPVIDRRRLGFETALHLAIRTPVIAVGKPADPEPWHLLAYAPLHHVTALYHAAGAEVLNLPAATGAGAEAAA